MNINTCLKKIPSPELLIKRLLAYAKIDYLMNYDEEEYKVYHYDDKEWIVDGHFFRIDDSGGDHYYVLASPAGIVIKGFAYAVEWNTSNFEIDKAPCFISEHDFYFGLPPELSELLDDSALEKEFVTFCIWQTAKDKDWKYNSFDIPDDVEDGSHIFLTYVSSIQDYLHWFEDYYEQVLEEKVFYQIYNGIMTKALVEKVPTKCKIDALLEGFSANF